MIDQIDETLQWRVHVPNLLSEIMSNHGMGILSKPLTIFGRILAEVGDRAIELNDPELNALMCRLTIFTVSDPLSPDYQPDEVSELIRTAQVLKKSRRSNDDSSQIV
jgi:hypothetical protein